MPTYNLAETVYNKWLQQYGNNMTCLYEAMVGSMICAYMQIMNYMTWLKGGYAGKGHYSTSLKPKVASKCGDSMLLMKVMKFLWGAKDVNTRDCALRGWELFGPTIQKFDLPLVLIVTPINMTK